MDYGSVLWAPVRSKGDLLLGEEPLRFFTRKAWGLRGKNYWERLEAFNLSSNIRRMERYRIMYVWKSLNGLAPSLGLEWSETSNRSGKVLKLPSLSGSARYKTLQLKSIKCEGAKFFNVIPEPLKVWTGKKEVFKKGLDLFLAMLPDQPETEMMKPNCSDYSGNASNSIVDWARVLDTRRLLEEENRRGEPD